MSLPVLRFQYIKPNSSVRVLVDKSSITEPITLKHLRLFTAPCTPYQNSVKRGNHVVAFLNDTIKDHYLAKLSETASFDVVSLNMSYSDLMNYSDEMGLPFVVITNSGCDIDTQEEFCEVFYKDMRQTNL